MATINEMIRAASNLASDDNTNPEYDRALVELVSEFFPGGDLDTRKEYLYPIITGHGIGEGI